MKYDLLDLKGVGEKKKEELNKLGIFSIEDLLEYFPRTYEIIGESICIDDAKVGRKNLIKCKLIEPQQTRIIRKNLKITKIKFDSEGSIFYATFFNNPYISSYFKKDMEYKLYGKVEKRGKYFEMTSPKYALLNDKNNIKSGLNPVYPLSTKSKLTNKELVKYIINALDLIEIKDSLPKDIKEEYGLLSLKEAYTAVHNPIDIECSINGNKRLTFDEFCGFNLSIILNKNLNMGQEGEIIKVKEEKAFLNSLSFELTKSQVDVIKDIKEDFSKGKKMNRLIQGDVGSGKTVVAMYAIYLAVLNGYQAVFCAPTKILAMQHYENIKELFAKFNFETQLLHSNMSTKERNDAYEKILSGKSQIIVGTHAVFSKNVKYGNLALAVIDEQHRFGVEQRGFLSKKGSSVHTLVMSATPIPRTLALSLYNDLDVSVISQKPKGRKEIKTYFKDYSYYDRIYTFARKEALKKNQVYVVCPSIDSTDLKSAKETYEKLSKTYFKDLNVALIHARLPEEEKDIIMESFYKHQIDVLVSTSVIEVGIDSKDATLIIIEGADRFGLASLHQLRGRVGRNDKESYCILLSENNSKKSMERLNFLSKNTDGFKIAMYDLKTRGSGDILGTRQSGKEGYNIYKLIENSELFSESKDAMEMILNDNTKENREYLRYIKEKYSNYIKNITWN